MDNNEKLEARQNKARIGLMIKACKTEFNMSPAETVCIFAEAIGVTLALSDNPPTEEGQKTLLVLMVTAYENAKKEIERMR